MCNHDQGCRGGRSCSDMRLSAARASDEGGYFFKPTVLGNIRPGCLADQVEIFGSVLSVIEYETIDQAMDILNRTEFGLSSALYSNSNEYIRRFVDESQNGMLHMKHGMIPDNNMRFSGIKKFDTGAYPIGPTAIKFYTSDQAKCKMALNPAKLRDL
jgi:acyl-CoA reductase-like NAD-dependent aldehyde dehydrogenase